MEVKLMLVPGKIARLEVAAGTTVLGACRIAEQAVSGPDWTGLAKSREVRVQNRKFSCTEDTPAGYTGSIHSTPLTDGDVVLILTKIEGNWWGRPATPPPGEGVLTCTVDGAEYALETPEQVGKVLVEVVGYDLSKVAAVTINGQPAEETQLVGAGDDIRVEFAPEPVAEAPPAPPVEFEAESPAEGTVTVRINGHQVTGAPADIRRILFG